MVGRSCVFQSERHYPIAIGPLPCDERGLLLVVGVHANLVVIGESIHKSEEFMAICGIYYKVDPRKREAIFRACSINVSKVDVESPFVVRFFDEYDVGQPLRVLHFSDRTCLEELSDLLINRFLSLWSQTPSFLLDGFE